jgi:RecQ mediated genome instability protein
LQITHILNIGVSAYSQYQKIKKGQEDNSEVSAEVKIQSKWEPKGQRMLMLHVTDGFQDVQAMEYVPIPQLNLDIIPGCKILIKGPVECRRGVMLLHPKNVEVMGGEVQELVDVNAPENVLARIIGRQENPTPVYGSYTRDTQADKIVETTIGREI